MLATSQLARLRKRYGDMSQEDLARAAGVTLGTIQNAEAGRNVSYSTARAILKALNEVSETKLLLEDLGLSIV